MPKQQNTPNTAARPEENNVPLYLFHQGANYQAYEFMGVHKTILDGREGMICRVWAPNALRVSIAGDFNQWKEGEFPLQTISDGVWETFLPFVLEPYAAYKFCIVCEDGKTRLKSDPYAYHFETRPGTASPPPPQILRYRGVCMA